MPEKRCAWPMAMPSETPMPCMVKQTEGLISLPFAELVGDERLDGVERRRLVLALGLELDARAQARGEHHHAHDALGVHAPGVARDEELRLEAPGELGELGRGARVQPEL